MAVAICVSVIFTLILCVFGVKDLKNAGKDEIVSGFDLSVFDQAMEEWVSPSKIRRESAI